MTDCLFCKIRDGEIPSEIVYENEHVLAFNDINPVAPVQSAKMYETPRRISIGSLFEDYL